MAGSGGKGQGRGGTASAASQIDKDNFVADESFPQGHTFIFVSSRLLGVRRWKIAHSFWELTATVQHLLALAGQQPCDGPIRPIPFLRAVHLSPSHCRRAYVGRGDVIHRTEACFHLS